MGKLAFNIQLSELVDDFRIELRDGHLVLTYVYDAMLVLVCRLE